jgi:hypothetical protein
MDREEFLDHSAKILIDLQFDEAAMISGDDIPF